MSFLGYFSKDYADKKGREYYFDNAKFILIFFVVLAHALSPLKEYSAWVKTMWIVINSLHMPCLIIISGYFAKSYISKDGVIKRQRLLTYIMYYLGAQITVSLFEKFVLGTEKMAISVFAQRSSLWYLFCLILWFIILPYISKYKPSVVMICGFVFAILLGYDTEIGNFMSIARAINHFPFFMLGYYFKKEWIFKFRNVYTQVSAVITIGIITFLAYFYRDIIPSRVITSNYNYYDLKTKVFSELPVVFLNRIIFYIIALLLCASFMLLVPRGKAFFTRFGSRTLQVYILHRFLYLAHLQYGWWKPFNSELGIILLALIALAITFILSLKIFEYPFIALSKINLKRFEKKDAPEVKVE